MSGEDAGAPLTVVHALVDEKHLVTLRGELDAFTVPDVRAALAATDAGDVVLDLRDVTFIDSSGLAMIVEARLRLDGEQRRLVIGPRSDVVQRLLELSGVAARLDLDPTSQP